MTTNPIVFIDTETTSLRDDRQIWEVALIRRHGGDREEVCYMLDIDLQEADPETVVTTVTETSPPETIVETVTETSPPEIVTTADVLPPKGEVYYASCDDARAAGAAPLVQGQPGYRDALDRDRDGTACEATA